MQTPHTPPAAEPSDDIVLDFSDITLPPFYPGLRIDSASDLRFWVTLAARAQGRHDYIHQLLTQVLNVEHTDSPVYQDALLTCDRYMRSNLNDAIDNLVTEGGLPYFHSGLTATNLAHIDDCTAIAAEYKRLHTHQFQGAAA